MGEKHPCGTPKQGATPSLKGAPVEVWPVTRVKTPEDLLLHCMPAFGAAFVRRIYGILDRVIGQGVPIMMSIAGPVTVSNQHRSWLVPLLDAGWIGYLSLTDAICYHDGHDSLKRSDKRPVYEVPIEGFDEQLREQGIIRVTDIGFDEEVLFTQDEMITAVLRQPELQRKMTGTEFRYLLGKYYGAQEQAHGVEPGLLSTCAKHDIPVFVGAPGDGSAFLNSVKLWAMAQLGMLSHNFEIDVHAEVFESCAYHLWGLTQSEQQQIAAFILGGGTAKNFLLQPEPTLSQIFLLDDIRGYGFDAQIVGARVDDGSLTGAKPDEAHTWGKVSLEALENNTESYVTDYSTVMPLIVWALIEKRQRYLDRAAQIGEEALYAEDPAARGYIRPQGQFRLYSKREALVATLLDRLRDGDTMARLMATTRFPLVMPR